jgi:hypothetical protein
MPTTGNVANPKPDDAQQKPLYISGNQIISLDSDAPDKQGFMKVGVFTPQGN